MSILLVTTNVQLLHTYHTVRLIACNISVHVHSIELCLLYICYQSDVPVSVTLCTCYALLYDETMHYTGLLHVNVQDTTLIWALHYYINIEGEALLLYLIYNTRQLLHAYMLVCICIVDRAFVHCVLFSTVNANREWYSYSNSMLTRIYIFLFCSYMYQSTGLYYCMNIKHY
jgi:hypothetical protein